MQCVEVLLREGHAAVDVKDAQFGGTALIWAAQHGRTHCAQVSRGQLPSLVGQPGSGSSF